MDLPADWLADLTFAVVSVVSPTEFAQAADAVDAVLLQQTLADAVVDLIFAAELAASPTEFAQADVVVDVEAVYLEQAVYVDLVNQVS